MKLNSWLNEYRYKIKSNLRKLSYADNDFSKDDFIDALNLLNEFDRELSTKYKITKSSIKITSEQWFDLCHKYINNTDNKFVKEFFFGIWHDLRFEWKSECDKLVTHSNFLKPATKEEIEFARKHFSEYTLTGNDNKSFTSNHTFNDDAEVLDYRGHRFIIDIEWECAWYISSVDNSVHYFDLIWDWYFPIDLYIDLYEVK